MVTLETQQSLNFEIIIEETGKFILQYQNEMIGRQVSMGDRYDSDNTIYY